MHSSFKEVKVLDSTCEEKIAVALKYDPKKADAPFVVAKGKCWIADIIIDIAQETGVPVVKAPEIVHDLYELDILEEIPQELFKAVAEILVFIENL